MDVFETIRTGLAVRSYQDTPVPADVVERIVEAGRLTGSGMNRQPWHFIVVQDKAMLRRLGELAKTGPYTAQAPLAIVVLVEQTRLGTMDGSRAIQSMLLQAWSDGVGSNWVSPTDLTQNKSLLNIPDNMDILAVLPFGYPAQAVGQGKKNRKPLADVASRERYGQPFTTE
ncbi:MAG: nitroreductase family protein [Anaerolineae bacterium]